ncbi:MAG TPA: AAA family ATPase [Myxococcota bacterium]|nr:AAA family ATPase [Myxococcota bacterium]
MEPALELEPEGARIDDALEALQRLDDEIRKAFIGQDKLVEGVLVGLLARGNLLLEGLPGLGKTWLVKSLAEALSLDFSRIQFTPDLMPADVTGAEALVDTDQGQQIRFRPGPLFAHVVLADEINRATPKTQAALLEAMQEQAVTAGGVRRELEAPFFVIATQNPVEMEGTYPLPEAQLDRFLFKLDVPFPSLAELREIGVRTSGLEMPTLEPVLDRQGLLDLQVLASQIVVAPYLADYAARLVMASHPACPKAPEIVRKFVRYGASPRAVQALLQAGRAQALVRGKAWASTEDLRRIAPAILRHRILLGFEADLDGLRTDVIVAKLLETVPEE